MVQSLLFAPVLNLSLVVQPYSSRMADGTCVMAFAFLWQGKGGGFGGLDQI